MMAEIAVESALGKGTLWLSVSGMSASRWRRTTRFCVALMGTASLFINQSTGALG